MFTPGDLPVVMSCASLALADAGILMHDLVASVSLVRISPRHFRTFFNG
jgi:ribonuclease PH